MKVYILQKVDIYDDGSSNDVKQRAFYTPERAKEEFVKLRQSTVENDWGGVYDGNEILDDNYVVDDLQDQYYFFIYENGYAAANSCEISIFELEVEE